MKWMFYLYVLLLYSSNLIAQPCNSPSASFINQIDVENWITQNPNCDEITKDVVIGIGIENLDGLEHIKKIGGYLSISNCDLLKDIKGFSGLEEVGSWIRIQNNPLLQSFEGLNHLKKVDSEFFYIENNPLVKDLNPLSNLDSIKGIFQIWDMDSLIDLRGLSSLKYVANDFKIFKNDRLISLNGLDSLVKIDGSFRVYENIVLSDLNGPSPALTIESFLVIKDNPELSTCNIDYVCNRLLTNENMISISNNKAGCNSQQEVNSKCTTASSDIHYKQLTFYPNPNQGQIFIHGEAVPNTIAISNGYGKLFHIPIQENFIDISELPSGIYYLIHNSQITKIIKI